MSFYQIAKNTFRESLREPIFYLLLLLALLLISIFPMFSLFVFREQLKLVSDSCLATTLALSLVCAALSASHTVSREMKNGTVLLLLSKPVTRWSFIIAKIAGIMFVMTFFALTCEAGTIISISIAKDQFELNYTLFFIYLALLAISSLFGAARNYLAKKAFSESASVAMFFLMIIFAAVLVVFFSPHNAATEETISFLSLLPVLLLLIFAVWIMSALTVTLSTRLDMVANLTFCSLIFMGGLVSDYFFGAANSFSLSYVFYAILPNWQLFWLVDALAARKQIPWTYVFFAAVYSMTYISFLCFIATMFFIRKETALSVK
jgi:hypothetical protein